MSSNTSHLRTRSERGPAVDSPSFATLVGFPVLLVAALVALSYPLAAATALAATALAVKGTQFGLAALVRRTNDAPRRVTVPGVGTVTVSIAPL
ncbi:MULTISPECIES: hypothetical protein [Halomicrobium]|uniref:Uncharacterized protein n=1 Tax=Halomicrobium mukohataei TaxID=57705 RepID=A0A847TTY2_9EURY|nr:MULTISPECIES: hypothetical protein [Halomicrobium]MBO4247981.1 hypothetical protein [Halomicrobium sp. IBSBa]NLV09502.1 hypothetical protein [Halomicrobium mukohataei]QGA81447.1 hypothetical protein LC1Hm_0383 [Halomicrobium sp. LC1Hm]